MQPRGGRLKLLARGETVPEFDDIAFNGELGVVHGESSSLFFCGDLSLVVVFVGGGGVGGECGGVLNPAGETVDMFLFSMNPTTCCESVLPLP